MGILVYRGIEGLWGKTCDRLKRGDLVMAISRVLMWDRSDALACEVQLTMRDENIRVGGLKLQSLSS